MSRKITPEKSLFLQSLATTSLLAELQNNDFINSEYFSNLKFDNNSFKQILVTSGIGNPACMQMMIYALLIIPKEILTEEVYSEINSKFIDINKKIDGMVEEGSSTNYKSDQSLTEYRMDYLRHIRNAVSHARCEYKSDNNKNFVTFKDISTTGNECCEIKIECQKVGLILMELQKLMIDYYIDKNK